MPSQTENPFGNKKSAKKVPMSKLRYRAKLTQNMNNAYDSQKAVATFLIKNSRAKFEKDNGYETFEQLKRRYAIGPNSRLNDDEGNLIPLWKVESGRFQYLYLDEDKIPRYRRAYFGDWNWGIGKIICEMVISGRFTFENLQELLLLT